MTRFLRAFSLALLSVLFFAPARAQTPAATSTDLSHLLNALRAKGKTLESNPAMRAGFESFGSAHHLAPDAVHYSDYVVVHLLFEATRDAGFWGMRWSITDQPPNSDRIWGQWTSMRSPSFTAPTAIAECDELSALYAFLVERTGVKSVGLFWPHPNHTVAVWMPRLSAGPPVRVVIPTSQIFLADTDTFDTRKFDPWHQKTVYEYTRRDVPDSLVLPKPLFDFFLQQLEKYAGASESSLQQIRNLRSAVFAGSLTPDQAKAEALRIRAGFASSPEDSSAFSSFAADLGAARTR